MAQNTTDGVNYYVVVDSQYKSDLSVLRQWNNLKVAFDGHQIWMTNFDFGQIESVEVKSIPRKSVFYSKNGKLFLLNSLLPDRNEPALLWTPIQRAFPVKIEKLNHNYFGIDEKIEFKIIEFDSIQKEEIMLVSLIELDDYINTAPEIRLKNIEWVIVDKNDVLLFGTPLLPLNGKVFWRNNLSVFPVGYNFDLHTMSDSISEKINPEHDSFIFWNEYSSYFLVKKDLLMPLSLGSFRKTKNKINNIL